MENQTIELNDVYQINLDIRKDSDLDHILEGEGNLSLSKGSYSIAIYKKNLDGKAGFTIKGEFVYDFESQIIQPRNLSINNADFYLGGEINLAGKTVLQIDPNQMDDRIPVYTLEGTLNLETQNINLTLSSNFYQAVSYVINGKINPNDK